MTAHSHHQPSRRDFLRRTGQLALGSAALPMALNLAAIGRAAAFNAPGSDYKALVCVFLYGGNDYANTVVPYDNASYDQYSTIRGGGPGRTAGGIALAQADLASTVLNPTVAPVDSLGVSRQFALHPSMTGLAGLFNAGHAAVQLNVGPLVKPLSRADYHHSNRTLYPRPPQLFSHNDQASIWQSSSPEGSKIGWGGNVGDLVIPGNAINSNPVFTGISVAGNTVFLAGDTALQYQVSTNGAIKIQPATNASVYGSTAVPAALSALVQQTRSHKLENDYNAVTRRAIAAEAAVAAALAEPALRTSFGSDSLSRQLMMVARLIKGRAHLGARRQVFFVSIGGFDLHDNLIAQHPTLLGNVSAALTSFYNATVDDLELGNAVTTFTASDFGRTLTSNGDGSDHGWGSHHFIVGGAVNGRAFYGTPPPVSVSDAKTGGIYDPPAKWHVGQGRLLPSTSVDQYAATLAKWFGVDPATEMASVLPNIVNFGVTYDGMSYPTDLGFMA